MMTRMALAAALFFAVFVAQAMELGPRETVERGTNQILADFKVNRGKYEADKEQLYAMVKRVALPNFDFERMSKLVLGRHWRQASPEEFGRFQQEFQDLLVRTYATALFEYTGQPINYRPAFEDRGDILRALLNVGREDITVHGVRPHDRRFEVLGASSGYLILNVSPAAGRLGVGDELCFSLDYSALLAIMTSEYVEKRFMRGGVALDAL